MSIEYLRFSRRECIEGKKGVLEIEYSTLNILKKLREYLKLRKEELALKIALKNKIEETSENLKILDKLLPKTSMLKVMQKMSEEEKIAYNKDLTLEEEINEIKRKLSSLMEENF